MPPQDAYLESQILSADPLELVKLLYRKAGEATRNAAVHLAAGRIAERSHQICRAHAILSELTVALDHTRGGTLSGNLAGLYDYMQHRLLEANQRQAAEPLVEVEGLLATLLAAWEQVPAPAEPPTAASRPQTRPERTASTEYAGYPASMAFVPEMAPEYAGQSWSF